MSIASGIYRHYKGRYYLVVKVATHSETREALVFYRCLYGDYSWWVRPLSMFTEAVNINNAMLPRFELIRPMTTQQLMDGMGDGAAQVSAWQASLGYPSDGENQ